MNTNERRKRFESEILEHLDAAYNLARWLMRDDQLASEATQSACLKAFRLFDRFDGEHPRAWLLTIVRRACSDLHSQRSAAERVEQTLDDPAYEPTEVAPGLVEHETPESTLLRQETQLRVRRCVDSMPVDWRAILILRELEGFSYREIGQIVGIPIGTVMSRLARARAALRERLRDSTDGDDQ